MSAGGIRNQQGLRVQISPSVSRQTPKTDFGSVVGRGLSRAGDAVLRAGQLAAPYIPGGAVLSAAITGVGELKSSAAGMTSTGGSNAVGLQGNGTRDTSASGLTSGPTTGGDAFDAVKARAEGGDGQAQLMMATKQMQEMNMSFNLQYLQLQQKMQSDNRQFTLLSNIMKSKHDTAKNAINNVR